MAFCSFTGSSLRMENKRQGKTRLAKYYLPLEDSKKHKVEYKILLIGDSGVGKSSILLSFISNTCHDLSPTMGVDFKIKLFTVNGKRLKLPI
ncbi:hypothetical protein Dsin_024010 [Dipteronia sinensis]|uniref:Uncharacterized protein n=1 Tax=Dipteronia sinensis TaxID=43782 RepID=A0AAE0A4F9_9ROSI|nr:hypothetical protein Dsin_024010 [Dipteronia sinensis]